MFSQLVVTGTGRSGTKSAAHLFTNLGWPTKHQEFFNGTGWSTEFTGDSNGLAAPFVRQLPLTTLVIHQVRNPRKTIQSLVANGHVPEVPYDSSKKMDGTQAYAKFCTPIFQDDADSFERACNLWVYWNRMVEAIKDRPNYRFQRLEDYTLETYREIFDSLGAKMSEHALQILTEHPKNVGTNKNLGRWTRAVEARDCPAWQRVVVQAARYGYPALRLT